MKKKTTPPPKPKAKAKPAAAQRGLAIDTKAIRSLADLLNETGLSEISWSQAGVEVRVARALTAAAPAAVVTAAPAAAAAPAVAAAADDPAKHPGAVKSPMVGTAYVAPEPGSKPFVSVGDQVKPGQTLLIVEAMKTMNPIPAPRGGRVVQILVGDKQPVEFGQALLILE